MSLTVLSAVLTKLAAGSTAAKGALGVAVAAAAIGTAGATGTLSLVSAEGDTVVAEETVTTEDEVVQETPAEAEVVKAPVEEVDEQDDTTEEAPVAEAPADEVTEEEPVEEESEEGGVKAGTFGAVVQEIKRNGGTGQDVAAAAHEKNAERKAARTAEGKGAGAPEVKGKPEGGGKKAEPAPETVDEPEAEEPAAEEPAAPAGDDADEDRAPGE